MEGCGSQQSLPEMVVAGGGTSSAFQHCNGFSGTLGGNGCETSNAEQINADLASGAIIPLEMQNRTGGITPLRPAKSLSGISTKNFRK